MGLRSEVTCWGPRCPFVWLLQGIPTNLPPEGNVLRLGGGAYGVDLVALSHGCGSPILFVLYK